MPKPRVRGRRDRVYGTESVFLVAAAVILPLEFAPFVAVPGCLIYAFRREAAPFLLLHNVFTAALATLAASAIAHTSHQQPTAGRAGDSSWSSVWSVERSNSPMTAIGSRSRSPR